GIPFYVLDRPNPLGGEKIEGNITEPAFRSGVSPYPIPYLYGLTVGELAQMINGEGWSKKSDLHVVKMAGWNRSTLWFETGLPWVPTSPHVPRPESAFYYAATGIVGELDGLSIGIGVLSSPFELAGAPKLPATEYAQNLSKRSLPGYQFAPVTFSPTYAIFKGQTCSGVQIGFTDYASAPLTRLNFELMDAARAVKPSIKFFASGPKLFDKVCGTDKVRKMYQAGKTSAEIWAAWNSGAEGFRVKRAKYLLY
ncbi:MAG: DUF1343 domain-containing protein, partial [bacterium]